MNALAKVTLALAVVVAAGVARGEDKKEIDKNKVIGTWKVTKSEGAPPDAVIEFTKDGKLIVTFEINGEKKTLEGTYKLNGDKLETAIKIGDMKMTDTDTIKAISDDKMSLVDKDGKATELEKVKKKK